MIAINFLLRTTFNSLHEEFKWLLIVIKASINSTCIHKSLLVNWNQILYSCIHYRKNDNLYLVISLRIQIIECFSTNMLCKRNKIDINICYRSLWYFILIQGLILVQYNFRTSKHLYSFLYDYLMMKLFLFTESWL